MTALTKALKINIRVAYLDGHSATTVNFVDFLNNEEGVDSNGAKPAVLLYRYVGGILNGKHGTNVR